MNEHSKLLEPKYLVLGHFRAPIDALRFQTISGYADIEFRKDNGFPERVFVYPNVSAVEDPTAFRARQDELVKLIEYGGITEIGILPAIDGGRSEPYAIQVVDVREDGMAVLAVHMPTYVPPSPTRHIIGPAGRSRFRDELFDMTGTSYVPVYHLTLAADLELQADVALRKFGRSDLVELIQHVPLERHNLGSSAYFGADTLMLHLTNQDTSVAGDKIRRDTVWRVQSALMLFKPGIVTFGNIISIQSTGLGNGIDAYPFAETNPYITANQYEILADEFPKFQEWWQGYSKAHIEDDSPVARAETRLLRCAQGEQSDRLTDAIIGLETLVMSGQKEELRYRIGLRVAHLLIGSNEPIERIKLRKEVRTLYDQRSSVVHESASNLKNAEGAANRAREILRSCIRAILMLPEPLRTVFCTPRKDRALEDEFFELIVATGNVPDAIAVWQNEHPTTN